MEQSVKFLRSDQFPRFAQMRCKFLVTDARKLNAYPTCNADIRWPVKLLRIRFDQRCLNADRRWYRYRDVAVVVMIN